MECHATHGHEIDDPAPGYAVRRRRQIRRKHRDHLPAARPHSEGPKANLPKMHGEKREGNDASRPHCDPDRRRVRARLRQGFPRHREPKTDGGVEDERREDEQRLDEGQGRQALQPANIANESGVTPDCAGVRHQVDSEEHPQRDDTAQREDAASEECARGGGGEAALIGATVDERLLTLMSSPGPGARRGHRIWTGGRSSGAAFPALGTGASGDRAGGAGLAGVPNSMPGYCRGCALSAVMMMPGWPFTPKRPVTARRLLSMLRQRVVALARWHPIAKRPVSSNARCVSRPVRRLA